MESLMKRSILAALVAATVSAPSLAATFTLNNPVITPKPATDGTGLTGQLWTNVDPNTNSLAQAQAIINGGFATANFRSTTIDYPAGATDVTLTSDTYNSVLDATAQSTLDNTSILTDDVLNTVMRFAGFFGANAGEIWTFSILSDDGSAVDIGGTRILNNDGIHGFGGLSTTVEFVQSGLYAIDVLFFESQVSHWGLEFAGGLEGSPVTTDLTTRLYTLIDNAPPDDPRLGSIQPTAVPLPGTLLLIGAGLAGLGITRRRWV